WSLFGSRHDPDGCRGKRPLNLVGCTRHCAEARSAMRTGILGAGDSLAAAFVLAAVASSSADESIVGGVEVEETVASALVSSAGEDGRGGAEGLSDPRFDYPASRRVAQAAPTPERPRPARARQRRGERGRAAPDIGERTQPRAEQSDHSKGHESMK